MNSQNFNDILKKYRSKANISTNKAAEHLFVSPTTYRQYENGRHLPNPETLIRISSLYHIHIVELAKLLIPGDVLNQNPTYEEELCSIQPMLTNDENSLLEYFSKLNYNTQTNLLLFLKAISNS